MNPETQSGGQKRRVSLAAALVHSPPLLILDEPTVGVDPLLRQSIWKHLVTLAQNEKITVVITTHYIEEARQANVVGLMRQGKLLAEDSPDNLMAQHGMDNLEDVFLKLCITDSSRKAAKLAGLGLDPSSLAVTPDLGPKFAGLTSHGDKKGAILLDANGLPIVQSNTDRVMAKKKRQFPSILVLANSENNLDHHHQLAITAGQQKQPSPGNNNIGGDNECFSSVSVVSANGNVTNNSFQPDSSKKQTVDSTNHDNNSHSPANSELSTASTASTAAIVASTNNDIIINNQNHNQLHPISQNTQNHDNNDDNNDDGIRQRPVISNEKKLKASAALNAALNSTGEELNPNFIVNRNNLRSMVPGTKYAPKKVSAHAWFKSLLAVIWKNYIRLKRNPPVLIFEFILPAVQVILFCLCIGGDPFDVPLAVVNDEVIPQASKFFLDAIDKNAIRQVPFSNLSDAIESVKRGETWGAIHIPDRYTQYLQERLTHPADITNETLTNGTINIYPDLTNLHLALAMENTFREAFVKFAKDTLNMFGYDPEAAELPIRVEEPVYGTLKRNGYLEFMAPGVVISITYVMATGLTALAFILEKRDGLLERSLVSGVTTSQILLAHASVQVLVMTIQISLVLAFTFFVFEIPSNGPFFWVVLLILLQGCTGMGFGLLVSAVCDEENTAVMMLVGTFYTNLILAGIIWPIEAMPKWIRWVSYAQPQTLPTETLRNILSRGWGIGETGVYMGFAVTIGWLVVFLLAAGLFMRYSK